MHGDSVLIKRAKLEEGLELLHKVLVEQKTLTEDLRFKLIEWRTDVQWEIEQLDKGYA